MTEFRSTLYPLVSLRRLEQLLHCKRSELRRLADSAGGQYNCFDLRKAHGKGAWRHIDTPTRHLANMQQRIRRAILSTVSIPLYVLGGVRGRSISDNAKFHVRKRLVITWICRNAFRAQVTEAFSHCSFESSAVPRKLPLSC